MKRTTMATIMKIMLMPTPDDYDYGNDKNDT
jgi:hypothetical protein